ncbi:MAG: hypothetical protein HY903_10070 [Deltaproteobacteria bacterium]|nr:hypothetical protein [Deltaproteobacteria bacterium]
MSWGAAVLLAMLPAEVLRAAHGDEAVGINSHLSPDDTYAAIATTGMPWVRIDVNWKEIEPQQGVFNWHGVDAVLASTERRGLLVFATFGYTPSWASAGDDDGKEGNDPPRPGLYEAALTAAVRNYAGRIRHWGLWNEANLDDFWRGTAQQYVDLIIVPGAAAVKTACPSCFVLGPELAHQGGKVNVYLDTVLGQAGDLFDIITTHTYHDFPEMAPLAGITSDSFFNSMDTGRPFVNQMGIREALAKHHLEHKEVWLTETGYSAEPATDPEQMALQERYIELVLAAQKERDWWTNTFFYEAEDCGVWLPSCTAGYGLLHRTTMPPDNSYANNFVFKPALAAITDFINANPEFRGPPPVTYHVAAGARGVLVDGDLREFDGLPKIALGPQDYQQLAAACAGAADLSGDMRVLWTPAALYLGVQVTDDVHVNGSPDATLWEGDSLQLGFDADHDRTVAGYDTDGDYELNVALTGSSRLVAQTKPQGHGAVGARAVIVRGGSLTRYEIEIPAADLVPATLAVGRELGFSWIVNDNDGAGREGFEQWTAGIGAGKNPRLFGVIVLDPPGAGTDSGPIAADGAAARDGADPGATSGDSRSAADAAPMNGDADRPPKDEEAFAGGGCACRLSAAGSGASGCLSLMVGTLWLALRQSRRRRAGHDGSGLAMPRRR